VNSVMK